MASLLKMDLKDLFKKKDKTNNAEKNPSVKGIIIKRFIYILLLILIFSLAYFFYFTPKIAEQEQKKYRLLNWETQIEVCKNGIDELLKDIKNLENEEKKSSGLFVSNEEFETFYANIIEQTIGYNLQIKDITRGEDVPVYQQQDENLNNFDNFNNFDEPIDQNTIDPAGISCNDGSQFMDNSFDNNMDGFDPNMNIQDGECDQSSGENCGTIAYHKMLVTYEITGSFLNYLNFRKLISSQSKIVNVESEEIIKADDKSGNILAKATVSLVRN